MQTYFEKDYLVVWYDDVNNILRSKWKEDSLSSDFIREPDTAIVLNNGVRYIDSDNYREGMEALIAATKLFKTGKYLMDTTHGYPACIEDQQWTIDYWFERSLAAGKSHVAIILPHNIYAQLATEEIMSKCEVPCATFYNIPEAIDWLKQF